MGIARILYDANFASAGLTVWKEFVKKFFSVLVEDLRAEAYTVWKEFVKYLFSVLIEDLRAEALAPIAVVIAEPVLFVPEIPPVTSDTSL